MTTAKDGVETEAPAAEAAASTKTDLDLEDIPLFATKAPEEGKMNETFEALSCVMDESTPDELALGLRQQGNASFNRVNNVGLRDAVDCYTQSLSVKGVKDPTIHAVTHLNRAAAHLKLENYGSAIADCEAALAVDPHLYKAHYRAAEALKHLGRWDAALRHCDAALADKETPEKDAATFKRLREECEVAREKEAAAAAARELQGGCKYTEIDREALEELSRRGVAIGDPLVDTEQLTAQSNGQLVTRVIELIADATSASLGNALSMPVVLLYEEVGIVDCVAAFLETRPLSQLLAEVFAHPPEWDSHGKYRRQTVEMYVELRKSPKPKIARLKPSSTLRDLLRHPQYVLPRMPVISIVSTQSKAFRKTFLSKYA